MVFRDMTLCDLVIYLSNYMGSHNLYIRYCKNITCYLLHWGLKAKENQGDKTVTFHTDSFTTEWEQRTNEYCLDIVHAVLPQKL
jgi:hypothetical protein